MSVYTWNKDVVGTAQSFESRGTSLGSRGDSSSLLLWAVWSVDSLYYLEEIIDADHSGPNFYAPHNPATKAIAHLRWASVSSITAIDLCAAVIARERGLWTSGIEFDARKLIKVKNTLPNATVLLWPNEVLDWLDQLINDPDYSIVLKTRNPLTHSRLIRHFTTADPSIRLVINETTYTTDELFVRARDLATRRVEAFLEVVGIL